MTPTSPAFRALTIVAAVLATAITAALWNRVRGRRVIRTLTRLGLLMLSYVLTAIAVLVSINIAYGGLISSWGDLFDNLGQGPPHQVSPVQPPGTAPTPHSAPVPPGAAFRPK
jgi:hypothetical protein